MEESLKTRIILILVILTAIFFIGTLKSCSNANQYRLDRDKEMGVRLDLQEKMSKFDQKKTAAESKLGGITTELEEEKVAHQATKKALLQEQLVNQSLTEELQKVAKFKEALEEDLKEALIRGKATKTKR